MASKKIQRRELIHLKEGDEIIAVDVRPTPTWNAVYYELIKKIGASPSEVRFTIKNASNETEIYTLSHLIFPKDSSQFEPIIFFRNYALSTQRKSNYQTNRQGSTG